jgi:homoprotocatechuate degradation regulator HpaR
MRFALGSAAEMIKHPRRPIRTAALARPAVALPVLSRSLAIRLLRSREQVMRFIRPHLHKLDLTEQQWRVLRVIHESGPIDAGRLATDAVLLPPSVSRIVRDLVRRGVLVRRSLSYDRRRIELSMTPKGTAVLRAGARDTARAYRTIARLVGAKELKALLALLDRLDRRLSAGGGKRRA